MNIEPRRLSRPIVRTLSQTPQLHGWWTDLKHTVSNVTDSAGELVRDVGHAVATQVRKVPGGSIITTAVGTTYSLATDVTDKIGEAVGDVGDFLERQVRRVVKDAVRPVVNSFRGDSPFFLGADVAEDTANRLAANKSKIIAASLPAASSAGGALGSAIPGVGSAAGAAAGVAVAPTVVSEMIDELIAQLRSTQTQIANAVTPSGASPVSGEKTDWTPVLVVGGVLGGLYFLSKKKR